MSRVLVTGVNGFVGKHLVTELKERGCEVVGLGREEQPDISLKSVLDSYQPCDLTDAEAVNSLSLESIDIIISLAGLVRVGTSFADADNYKKVNVSVLANICQKLLDEKLNPHVVAVSSGAVYDKNQHMPLTEESKLAIKDSPYVMSKIMMEKAARDFIKQGLRCTIVRPFNHAGPGQAEGFLIPDIYTKALQAKKTGQPIKIGSLKSKRDYTDVRDVVRAYADLGLADSLERDLYNVSSGRSVSGTDIAHLVLSKMGLVGAVEIIEDPSLIRPHDPLELVGNSQRLQAEVGWQPTIPIEQTIEDFITAAG